MPIITVNNKEISVPDGITLIQACELADIEIPRFCYHERLAIAGNCRMCLVEVEGGAPKPVASCATQVANGMKIRTDSTMVKKAREGVMEFLLANHPLDCPICDQGGECDLQDQSMAYGSGTSRYSENKRAVKDKNLGPLIKTAMNRCIHCTRCVRFISDVAGIAELGAVGRGEDMEITSYLDKALTSELSGNIIDLCPVGALTSKPYAFKARPWELTKTESIDVMDGIGSNIRLDVRGLEVMRILPRLNEEINEEWISDKTRFCYDGLKNQRLDKAYIKKDGKLIPATIAQAFEFISEKIKKLKGDEIAALTGDLAATEEVMALKLLMQKLGSDNIDCRGNNSALDANDRASYVFNSKIAGIEQADSCLLIGTNPRNEAAIINARIRKRFLMNGEKFKIAAIGFAGDLTYPYIHLGNEAKILKGILEGKNKFCEILKNSKRPMMIIGADIAARQDGKLILNYAKKIAEKYNFISDEWSGFNILHKNAAAVGALDVGFVSSDPGINQKTILEKAAIGQIKMVYLLGVDDLDFMQLKNSLVIYQGSHGENGAVAADVILPATTYAEKDAIYVNIEGRPQKTRKALFAPGAALSDWQMIYDLAKFLQFDLGFNDLDSLRALLIKQNPIFAKIDLVSKNNWIKAAEINEGEEFDEKEIVISGGNFYSSNVIARNSRIMMDCRNMAVKSSFVA